MKLKVGDKVRYTGEYYSTCGVGVLVQILSPNTLWPYLVDFEKFDGAPCDEHELELVE